MAKVLVWVLAACGSASSPTHAPAPTPVASAPNADPRLGCTADADCRVFESACHGCLGPVVSVNTAYANLGGALTFSLQLGVSCAEGGCPARHVTRTAFCHAGTCARHDVEHGTTTDVVTTAAELALPPERELLAGALVHVARHEAACGRGSAPPADLGEVPAPYACRELAPCYAIIDRLPCTPTLDFSFLQTLDADPACRAALAACTTPRHDGGSSNASE